MNEILTNIRDYIIFDKYRLFKMNTLKDIRDMFSRLIKYDIPHKLYSKGHKFIEFYISSSIDILPEYITDSQIGILKDMYHKIGQFNYDIYDSFQLNKEYRNIKQELFTKFLLNECRVHDFQISISPDNSYIYIGFKYTPSIFSQAKYSNTINYFNDKYFNTTTPNSK